MKKESHIAFLPFSITADAKEYLRSRLKEIPPQLRPILLMTKHQTDGLNPPRWHYEGRSFVLDGYDFAQISDVDHSACDLLGRNVAIESSALKHLSGRVLSLRRVASRRGLQNDNRYVLVANSGGASAASADKSERTLSIAALTILGGFTGMGVIWVVSVLAVSILKIPIERLFKVMTPLFVIGWIAGAIVSFKFFKSVFKTNGRSEFAQRQKLRKYFGYFGLEGELKWWIFLGIPVPLAAIVILLIEPFARTVREKSGFAVGAIVLVFGTAMYFCDRLPKRLVFRLGLLGWVFTLAFGYWYFKTQGP